MDKVAELLAGYPFDVLLGSVHWLGAWRFDDSATRCTWPSGRSAGVDACWDALHRGNRGDGGSGACDVLAHPDLVKVAGYSPDAPRGVVGPTGRGGRLERDGGRGLLGRVAQAL